MESNKKECLPFIDRLKKLEVYTSYYLENKKGVFLSNQVIESRIKEFGELYSRFPFFDEINDIFNTEIRVANIRQSGDEPMKIKRITDNKEYIVTQEDIEKWEKEGAPDFYTRLKAYKEAENDKERQKLIKDWDKKE